MSHAKPKTTFATLDRATLEPALSKLERVAKEMRSFDIGSVHSRPDERAAIFQRRVNDLLSDLVGMGSPDYKQYALGPIDAELDTTFGDHYSMEEYRDALKTGLTKAAAGVESTVNAIKAAIKNGSALAPEPAPIRAPVPGPVAQPAPAPPASMPPPPAPAHPPPPPPPPPPRPPKLTPAPMNMTAPAPSAVTSNSRVLVLGSGEAADHAAQLLAQLGLETAAVDTPSIEQLDAARGVGYAIVVTPKAAGESTMLAVGFMLALLGRSRIALLGGDAPAPLAGCTRVSLDDDGLWKLLLAREMKKAGLDVDLNRAI